MPQLCRVAPRIESGGSGAESYPATYGQPPSRTVAPKHGTLISELITKIIYSIPVWQEGYILLEKSGELPVEKISSKTQNLFTD
jgi:hypothetical protein